MSFPTVIYGDFGDEKRESTSQGADSLGTRMVLPDGRVFRYALAGEALGAGKLCMEPAYTGSDHVKDLAIAAAVSTGRQNTITITNGSSTAITANEFKDGYLFINDAAGEGQLFKILSHPAASASASCVLTLYPNERVDEALTTSSQAGLRKNEYDSVELWDADDVDGIPVGVCPIECASGSYFWLQTWGPAAVLTNGTVVVGKTVVPGATTDGSVDVFALTEGTPNTGVDRMVVGSVMSVAASTEYSLVFLTIAP